jgi:mono/diheme cytochrome c family protein
MRRLVWVAAVAVVAAATLAMFLRGGGISARRRPLPLEVRLARASWRFLVPSSVRAVPNPMPASQDVLREGREHWADHCATCHANDGSGDTAIGRGVFPPMPDMRNARTQSLTDGELFYAIEQGIPWTAMPAWGNGTVEGERSSWVLVRFVRHLPQISAEDLKDMQNFTPRSPADAERERDIDQFLNAPAPNAPRQGRGRR